MYEKPLIIKHTVEDLTDIIVRFTGDIKLKFKNIEIKLSEDFPYKSNSQYFYGIYICYPNTYKNKKKRGSTDIFPIYFDSETKFLSVFDSSNGFKNKKEIKLPNLFSALKKVEEYIMNSDTN